MGQNLQNRGVLIIESLPKIVTVIIYVAFFAQYGMHMLKEHSPLQAHIHLNETLTKD